MCKETLSRMAFHNKGYAVIEVIIQQGAGIPVKVLLLPEDYRKNNWECSLKIWGVTGVGTEGKTEGFYYEPQIVIGEGQV